MRRGLTISLVGGAAGWLAVKWAEPWLPAGPRTSIRRGQQRIHFWAREETDQGTREALARNRENALDLPGTLRQLKGRKTKEGMDRR